MIELSAIESTTGIHRMLIKAGIHHLRTFQWEAYQSCRANWIKQYVECFNDALDIDMWMPTLPACEHWKASKK